MNVRAELEKTGFVVLADHMGANLLQRVRLRVEELMVEEERNPGPEFRWEKNTRRLNNLFDKGDVFREAITRGNLLDLVESVLGPEFKLGALKVRSADANSDCLQPLHVDTKLPLDERGYAACTVDWMLDDFTIENGALRVVPGSHRSRIKLQDEPTNPYARHPEELLVTGRAGSAIVMNSHLWHGGTANKTSSERRALLSLFCRPHVPIQPGQNRIIRFVNGKIIVA